MSIWKDFVTAALLGTEKGQPPALPAPLEETLAAAQQTLAREEVFLSRAGALAQWRRAGFKPRSILATLPARADPEERPAVNLASASHLHEMLGGRFPALLPEWLRAISAAGLRVPFETLPALLNRAWQDRDLRPLVLAAGGKRVSWLAASNPVWAFGTEDGLELWETGTREQRVAILRTLRRRNPAEARAKVQEVWAAEPADVRSAFLGAFEIALSMEDEPFLETTLDDRSKEVRKACVDLLSRLPESRFVARMIARADVLLSFKSKGLLARAALEVTLPDAPDAAGTRDGLDPRAFGHQKTFGEKAVLLVLILSAVPPGHWSNRFRQEPAKLLKAVEKNEFARAIITGWAWAALRAKDALWAEAILDGGVQPEAFAGSGNSLLAALPEEKRAARLVQMIRPGGHFLTEHQNPMALAAEWLILAAQLETFEAYWPEPLAREVLAALRRTAECGIPWHLRATVERLLLRIPPALIAEAASGWPAEQEGISAITDFLEFRHDVLSAIQQQ